MARRERGRPALQLRVGGAGRDGGFVTAEAAVVLPSLVLVGITLVWALLAASAQIQCVDAARAGARAAARQDSPDAVVATARRAAPAGAKVTVSRETDLVRVTVDARTPGPQRCRSGSVTRRWRWRRKRWG